MKKSRIARNDLLACHDLDRVRRGREEEHVQLRKERRSERFSKRRFAVNTPSFDELPPALLSAIPELAHADVSSHTKVTVLLNFLKRPNPDPSLVLPSVRFLRQGLASQQQQKSPLTRLLVAGGFAEVLLKLLSASELSVVKESLWCVVNLTSEPTQITSEVAKPQTVKRVLELCQHKDPEILENSIWTIGNLAGDSPETKNYLLSLGVLPLLLRIGSHCEDLAVHTRGILLWAIGNLFRGDSGISHTLTLETVALLRTYSESMEDSMAEEWVWAVHYASQTNSGALAVAEARLLPTLVPLLGHSNSKVVAGVLRVIGNIVAAGSEADVEKVLQAGFLSAVGKLTPSPPAALRQELMWVLSNMLFGPKAHKLAILQDPLIQFIFTSARQNDFRVQDEVLFCLVNCLSDSDWEVCELLLSAGALETVLALTEMSMAEGLVLKALRVLDGLLLAGKGTMHEVAAQWEALGGVERLEKLQSHPSMKVYREVVRLMDVHFGIEETAETDDLSPPEGEFQFT